MIHRLTARVKNLLGSKFVRDTITLQTGTLILTAVNAVSFVIVVRALGPEQYGVYQLVLTMYGLLMTLNLTGLGPSTITRLAEAIGAADRERIRDLMGFFLQASAAVAVVALLAGLLFGPAFAAYSYANPFIGELFRAYALVLIFEPVYHLVLLTLQSLRAMRRYTLLENGALLLEAALKIAVVLLGYGAAGVIAASVAGSASKAAISLAIYHRQQRRQPDLLPGIGEVLGAMLRNSPRPFWRFGFLLALDKNVSGLYTLLPVQVLGMLAGEAAAGFLRLGLNALSYPNMLFRGVLTNLETRLPASAGQRNYLQLDDNFRRLMRWIVPLSAGLYGAFALLAPLVMPLLGEEYIPALPVIRVLCLYGFITGVGGAFGPLYRTLRMLGSMLATKVLALALAALPGLWLLRAWGPTGGAWTINLVYALAVGATIALVWPRLRRLARDQRAGTG
jgi:O-antigen/teichoic acid export membrane protein